ncbi:MAG: hypothetical protein OES79_08370 [Planctomycetota bacterium]|nr:hypothetical protein [Planctomycetota bacterium]
MLNRVSQALDHTTGNHQYSQALKAGLTALREAEDFQTGDRRLSTEVDLQHLVATHQTTALKDSGAVQQLTPVMAMQKYLEFAKERLVFASGRQPVASGALYGLARLETLQPQGRPLDRPIRGPRAIALHQAALMVDKGNYAAANELGVLLARYGQLDSAGDILSHAAKVSSVPETWHNLARVYELKGAGQEAAHARAMYHRLRADTRKADVSKNESRQVYWVAPETFGDERLSVAADAPQSPVLHEPSKTSQGSGHTPGWSKPQATTLNGKSGRGKPGTGPLHHLGRLMRGKRDTRNNAK